MADTLFSWQIEEYRVHARGKWWYILFVVLSVVLVIYAIVSANFLFLFILLMIAGIIFLSDRRSPRQLEVQIETDGLRIGEEWHPWKNIEYFWVVDEPEVQSIYFETSETWKPHLCVGFYGQDIEKIKNILRPFIREEQHEEPLADIVSRVLKI